MSQNPKIEFLPNEEKALFEVMNLLWSKGHEAYIAGGWVRDLLLGYKSKDIDIVTSARPDELEKLFPHHLPVGKQFGIIIVRYGDEQFEVATFRKDGQYQDGRHPEKIEYAGAQEDAWRRDFTINGLFYDLRTYQIIDYVEGQKDIRDRFIRAIGEPKQRFAEDYLRILRALRFEAQLNFQIEAKTWKALCDDIKNIVKVSGERISEELYKGLRCQSRKMLNSLINSGACGVLFSDFGEMKISNEVSKVCQLKLASRGQCFSLFFLAGQSLEAFELENPEKIKWNPDYLKRVERVNAQLKLSKEDKEVLQHLGAAQTWAKYWGQLREGFRLDILVDKKSEHLCELLEIFGEDKVLIQVDAKKKQLRPKGYLKGDDVATFEPKKRGSILKEAWYLEWEGKLNSREQALEWLKQSSHSRF